MVSEYVFGWLKAIFPTLLLAAISFWAGMWVQSGQTPVLPETVTRYIPSPEGYIDLPELSLSPVVTYVFTDPVKAGRDTVIVRDTIAVPKQWSINQEYFLFTNDAVRVADDRLYLSYFDPWDQRYKLHEYAIPEDPWRFTLSISTQVDIISGQYSSAGVKGNLIFDWGSVYAEANMYPLSNDLRYAAFVGTRINLLRF